MKNIVFIGPMAVGKTTVSQALARHLNTQSHSIDDLRAKYFKEIDYNHKDTKPIYENEGFMSVFRYWLPYQAYAVKRMMEDYSYSIIDFGAGFSMFDGELLKEVKLALSDNIVILILPSKDKQLSIQILSDRTKKQQNREVIPEDISEFLQFSLMHQGHRELADYIVYTQEKDVKVILQEVLTLLSDKKIDLSQYT